MINKSMMRTTDPTVIDFRKKFDLTDKVIIITGGCGLIGKAFNEACAQFGASVVVADIENAQPLTYAGELEKRHGRPMLGVPVDVADKSSVQNLLKITLEKFGKVNGLINGHQNKTNSFFQKFEEYTEENWDAVVDTNLKGTFLTCQVIGTWMTQNGGGAIINIPSTYSVVAPNQNLYKGTSLGCPAAYSASKGGVMALSQYLSTYWAEKNVRVNQITPHGVWNNHEKQFEENFANFTPLRRLSYNHEVAPAAVFLLSDAATYITGHNLMVDGGWTTW
jgi:NAD(P)-dependent dehydrogenase (short-subunit alcohol dehydrogenase family)